LWNVWKREPVQFLLQSEEGMLLTPSQQVELVLLLFAADTEELRAVGEMRKSIEVTR
jgi:hypothetical protein